MLLRPAVAQDAVRISGQRPIFSEETLYQRFMSSSPPGESMLNYLFAVDYRNHFAWVLVDPDNRAVVADGRFVRDHPESISAEIAFIVADGYQGRGAGAVLRDAVIAAADVAGISRLTAQMFLSNVATRALLNPYTQIWRQDEPGVVSTSFATPGSDALRTSPTMTRRLRLVASDVIRGDDGSLLNSIAAG